MSSPSLSPNAGRAEKIKPKSSPSIVWQYFKDEFDGGDSYHRTVVCVLCQRHYTMGISGTTSNLLKHIQSKHANDPPPIADPIRSKAARASFSRPKNTVMIKSQPDSVDWMEDMTLSEQSDTPFKRAKLNPMASRTTNHKASWVWRYFEILASDTERCSCVFCGTVLKYKYGQARSTTSLMKHLEAKHSQEISQDEKLVPEKALSYTVTVNSQDEMMNANAGTLIPKTEQDLFTNTTPSVSAFVPSTIKLNRIVKSKEQIDALFLKMIASSLQPFSVVENKNFYEWVRALNPQYDLPSREKLSEELLPQVYDQMQQNVKLSLQSQCLEKLTLSVESWVSLSSQQYVTVVAHFLTLAWEKKTFVLFTFQVFNGMSSIEVAAEFKKHLMIWEIQDKIFSVVMKTGSTGLAVLEEAIQHLELEVVPCFVHSLNNIIKEALRKTEDVAAVTSRVRGIASYLQYSGDGVSVLREIQGINIPLKKIIVKDDEDRWISTLNMFRCYIEQHEEISAALCYLGKTDDCVVDTDVIVMKKVVDVLEPFELAAEELCVENRATCSIVIPILKQLQDCLSDLQFEVFDFYTALSTGINELTCTYESSFTIGATTVLDPRFKYLPFSDSERAKNIESCLTSALCEVFETASVDSESLALKEESSSDQTRKSLWNRFDSKVNDILETSPPTTTLHTLELRRYFESKQPRRQEVHPVDWWKTNQALMPNLSKLAQQFLAIPASSVPGPMVLSKETESFVAQRSCLDENIVDKMLFLNKNYAVAVNPF